MEQPHGDAGVRSNRAGAHTHDAEERLKSTIAALRMGTTYGYGRMRVRCNYCQNVRTREATSGTEGMVERQWPMGPHEMVTAENKMDDDPT